MVTLWKHAFATAMPIQEQAFRTCLDVGDLAHAGYVAVWSVWQLIEKGETLDGVLSGSAKYAAFAQHMNNDVIYQSIRLEQQFVASLQGKTDDPLGMTGALFDEAASFGVVQRATFRGGIALYYIMKEILAFHQGRYIEALAAARAAAPYLPAVMALAVEATHRFYHALTLTALLPTACPPEKDEYAAVLADTARRFSGWAEHAPENFGARSLLLSAEIARIGRDDRKAMQLYEDAIRLARKQQCVKDEALALELCGQHCKTRGSELEERSYFRDTHDRYARWGAGSKVQQLERCLPYLRGEPMQPGPKMPIAVPVEPLDPATVVRVFQALASEIALERWIEKLMTIALEDSGAQRGVLLVPCAEGLQTLAEASMAIGGAEVRMPKGGDDSSALPSSVVGYVARTKETVLLDDAAGSSPFSTDAYIASRRSQSILCLPLVKRGELAGVLYLENTLAPYAFTPGRAAVLKLVASQAAVSLENARLYSELQRENEVRKRTEDALRRSKAYLAEAEHVSHTGAFGWDLSTGAMVVSDETYRLAGIEPSSTPITADEVWGRIHPDDAPRIMEQAARAIREGGNLDYEHRFVMPDGSVKFVRVLGRPLKGAAGAVEYVGAAMDITEARRAEAALHHAQVELAHVTRVTAMGELAASIAHEVNQPLAAISANANAALNWLAFAPPTIECAREALDAIVADSERAGDVLSRIRRLLSRSPSERTACEVNGLVSGVLPLVRSQFERQGVVLETALANDSPTVVGDAVQLQQVLLNLLLNAADACKDLGLERRRVMVRTAAERRNGEGRAVVAVADSGHGFDPTAAARIFEPFYTTKPGGLGMGLSISRSIVARHEGELTATGNAEYGVTFSLSLPLRP
jgi:PAS domain S-box-containing protein